MLETNRQKCNRLCIDDEGMYDISDGRRCEICNEHIEKNLSPTNPTCEGRWCDEALELWLDEEVRD